VNTLTIQLRRQGHNLVYVAIVSFCFGCGSPSKTWLETGKWERETRVYYPNNVTAVLHSVYEFHSDGTFDITAEGECFVSGDTSAILVTFSATEDGKWTVEGNAFCMYSSSAQLTEFESNTEDVSRADFEREMDKPPPESCFEIVEANSESIRLKSKFDSNDWTLTAVKQ
jgi:hypothetical protein